MKMCKLTLGEAQQFYAVHQGRPFYDKLTHFMSGGRIVAMELVRNGELLNDFHPCCVFCPQHHAVHQMLLQHFHA